jgi:tripeptide aminopeptidase
MITRLVLPLLLLAAGCLTAAETDSRTPTAAAIDSADLLERFCRYVRIDTASAYDAPTVPSTPGQRELLRLLERELQAIGASEITLTAHGVLMATLPATTERPAPSIAWFAHVDTVPGLPGAAKPLVHRAWNGNPITLPDNTAVILDPAHDPYLRAAIGQDIVTASGATVLGADNKSGVAATMAAARHLLRHPKIPHGRIRVCFTPDEETGTGAPTIDLAQLGADVGYTVDGGDRGSLNNETFSGDLATVEIAGVAIHPGTAKGVLVNALPLAARLIERLPRDLAPENTDGRIGFIHPVALSGEPALATLQLLLRDFEPAGLAAKRALLETLVADLKAEEPRARIRITFTEEYRNLRDLLAPHPDVVRRAQEAVRRTGIEPVLSSLRGGSDACDLTTRGLPTLDLFAGEQQTHSPREWVSVQDMTCAVEVLVNLAKVWAESSPPAP